MLYSTLLLALFSASLTAAVPSTHAHARSPKAHRRAGSTPSMSIQVKAQDDVNDPNDITVATTISNNGNKMVKILNDPNGPLSTWKTHTFDIVSAPLAGPNGALAKGASVQAGVEALCVKYNPLTAAALDDASAFTVLQPGENKTVVHDLAGMYNFPVVGEYTVKLTNTAESLMIVEDDGSLTTVQAKMYTGEEAGKWAALSVAPGALKSLKGLVSTGIPALDFLSVAENSNRMVRRRAESKFNNCTAEQQKDITAALPFVKQYIANANTYLGSKLDERFATWFGAQADNRTSIVQGHYANLTDKPDQFKFDCGCNMPDTYAFVYPTKFPVIHLCGAFWKAPMNGTDSKAGTLVHEATHFMNIGGTQDYVYGQEGAKDLAKSDPDRAVMNADSHEYFAENTPHLS